MVNIDDVLQSRYLLVSDNANFWNRIIIKINKITPCEDASTYSVYTLAVNASETCKLYHYKDERIYIQVPQRTDLLSILQCTNNFIELLDEGDTLRYNIDGDCMDVNVVKLIPKYRRIIVRAKGTNHNLSTVLEKYGTKNIAKIITRDEARNLHAIAHT